MPTYRVTEQAELPRPESWQYAASGGMEILSNASGGETSRLLHNFQEFRQVLQKLWPAPLKEQRNLALILCRKDNKFSDFTPPNFAQASLMLPGRERSAIVIDLEAVQTPSAAGDPLEMPEEDADTVSGDQPAEIDHDLLLNREYIRLLLSQSGRRVPAWLEEGICQMFIDTEFGDDWIVFGRVRTEQNLAQGGGEAPSAGELSFKYYFVGKHKQLMPLGEMFAVAHESATAQVAMGNKLWTKQAHAFVHLCLCGQNLRYRQALLEFARRLDREPLSEGLFKECFKTDYAGMLEELRSYLYYTKHKFERIKLAPADRLTTSQIALRAATPGEIGRLKGDAQLLAGRMEDAQRTCQIAYRQGAREPDLLAALGVAEAAQGNTARATPLLTAATRSGVDRPSAYVALARLRLAEGQAGPRGAGGKLDERQVAAILTPLFAARKLPVALPETYELIAAAWAQSAVAPKPENLAVLDEGIRAFPRDSALLYRAAQLYAQSGAAATAGSIARLGLRFTTEADAKTRFEQLLASLPPAPPST